MKPRYIFSLLALGYNGANREVASTLAENAVVANQCFNQVLINLNFVQMYTGAMCDVMELCVAQHFPYWPINSEFTPHVASENKGALCSNSLSVPGSGSVKCV